MKDDALFANHSSVSGETFRGKDSFPMASPTFGPSEKVWSSQREAPLSTPVSSRSITTNDVASAAYENRPSTSAVCGIACPQIWELCKHLVIFGDSTTASLSWPLNLTVTEIITEATIRQR